MANKAADLVFRNGLIVTPGGTIEGGVAILDGKIAAVGSDGFLPAADRQIDLAGKYLLPGAIDPECHLGSHRPLADDFQTETRAAAAAGVTTWGMQLVSLAITGGADKVKGPADIPSFTKAMPLYYEASRSRGDRFFSDADPRHRRACRRDPLLGERARHHFVQVALADAGAVEIFLAGVRF